MSTRPANAPSNAQEFRGIWSDPQTVAMLTELAAISGTFYVDPIEGYGSWADNSASGGIDNGAGHADLNLEGRTDAVCRWIETKARSLGFLAYWRPRVSSTGYVYKWQAHLHLVNKTAAGLSAAAVEQIKDYKAGLNGLANNGPDTGSRAYVETTWAEYLEENPMAGITLAEIVSAVWTGTKWTAANGTAYTPASYLKGANEKAGNAENYASKALAKATALEAAVAKLADAQGIDGAAIIAAVNEAVATALDDVKLTLTVAADTTQP